MKTNDNYKSREKGWGQRDKDKREKRRIEREAREQIKKVRR